MSAFGHAFAGAYQRLGELAALFLQRGLFRVLAGALGVGRRKRRNLVAHLRQHQHLLLLQGRQGIQRLVFLGISRLHHRRGRQRRGGATRLRVPSASHIRLGNGARFVRNLIGTRIDQNHFEGCVLEDAVEALGVDKAYRQQGRMHGH